MGKLLTSIDGKAAPQFYSGSMNAQHERLIGNAVSEAILEFQLSTGGSVFLSPLEAAKLIGTGGLVL